MVLLSLPLSGCTTGAAKKADDSPACRHVDSRPPVRQRGSGPERMRFTNCSFPFHDSAKNRRYSKITQRDTSYVISLSPNNTAKRAFRLGRKALFVLDGGIGALRLQRDCVLPQGQGESGAWRLTAGSDGGECGGGCPCAAPGHGRSGAFASAPAEPQAAGGGSAGGGKDALA